MTARLASRRSLLAATAFTVLALAGCGSKPGLEPSPGGGAGGSTEPTAAKTPTATASSSATPSNGPTVVEVDVDMGPARTVAVALATGNVQDVDVHQYLTGDAVGQADETIAAGRDVNSQTRARFGTVHHATTLNPYEKAEYSETNGATMLTVVTFGWDAPPDEQEVPQAARARMTPGSPGTLAWHFALDADTGLINGIWTGAELGGFD